MKKSKERSKSYFYFIPFLLLGLGCNNQQVNSSNPNSNSDNLSVSEDSSSIKQVLWDKEVDEALYSAVGDYYEEIPVFTADVYDANTFTYQGINIAAVSCYINDYLSSENTYSIVLKLSGFSTTQYEEDNHTYSIASKRVSSYEVLCLKYEVQESAVSGGYLYIWAYVIEDRLINWPSEQIIAAIGQDIPHCDAEYYQFATQDYSDLTIAVVACYGLDDPLSALANYLDLLISNSYEYKTLDSAYYCTNDNTGLEIDFYYDTDYEYLYIQAYVLPGAKDWPSKDLEDLFPVYIPEYHESGVRYFSGLAQAENKALIYEIDCTNASPSSEEEYKETLEMYGWVRCEEYDYESWGNIYIINQGLENECQIQFYYEMDGMTLVIRVLIMNVE